MFILGNGRLITRDAGNPYFENGAVAWDGGVITEVGETAALREKYPDAEFTDAKCGVIMPGLINAHTHIYSALARGLSINGYSPKNFYEVLDGMWWNIDRKLTLRRTRASAYATIIDCIKQGVTCIFDHHASYGGIEGSLFEIADAASVLGMRACLCYEVSDRDGEAKCAEAIRENAKFIRWTAQKKDDMIKGMFGMHALFTISDETFEKCVDACGGLAGYHIHVSEGTNDVEDSRDKYGMKPVDRLEKHGILGEKTILGHCIHVTPEEMDKIAGTNTMVVINPESNMSNAVGCAPVLDMYAKGIMLGLGTDAYTNDMLESIKVLLAMQRHNAKSASVGWCEATDMLFKNNARIAARYFDVPLGILSPGAAADIIVMDYKPFTPFSDANIDGHMLFGMTGRQCRTTIINGKIRMKDGELIGIDEETVNARICEAATSLWKDLNG